MIETAAQRQISLGRDINTLDPATRLAHFYAGADREPEPEKEEGPKLTKAQAEYLGSRKVEDLTHPGDIENFTYLGTDPFRDKTVEPAPKPVPFELDPVLLEGMSPTMKLQATEAFAIADQGRKEAAEGKHPSARRVQQHQVDSAMTIIRPFLRKVAS